MTFKASYLAGPGMLRLILALLVMLSHTEGRQLGKPAVYCFFMLSGYWISVMYKTKYQKARNSWLVFFVSRLWRLMPVYWLCFTMMIMVVGVLKPWDQFSSYVSSAWLFRALVMVSSASQQLLLVPAWSLDVEMQFYLLFPLLHYLIGRCSYTLRLTILICFCLAWSFISITWLLPPICFYLGFFILGMLMEDRNWHPSSSLLWLSAGVLGTALIFPYFYPDLAYLIDWPSREPPAIPWREHVSVVYDYILALATLPYIARCVHVKAEKWDRHWGDWAYSLYLFHWIPLVAFDSINFLRHLPHPLFLLLNWAVMLGGSWLIFKYFDQPIDAARRRFIDRWLIRNSKHEGTSEITSSTRS